MLKQNPSGEREDMGQLLDTEETSYRSLQRGEVVDGIIMKVDKDGLLVNVGQKTEGIVPSREMRSVPPETFQTLKVGDPILVAVVRPESEEGHALLSVDRARGEQAWRTLQQYSEAGSIHEAPVTGHNKGGAIVTLEGIQGFVPLSQLSSIPRTPPGTPPSDENNALAALVGAKIKVKVIEVNRKRNRAIFSERAAMQEHRQQQKQRLLDELTEGQVRKGRVSGITNFGVFVDLGGADGLIHISELSWESVRSPEDVVKVGDEVDVYVIKVDRENRRIALSLKRTRAEPWTEIATKLQVGQVVPATVTKLATFGAFARLEGGIEGLIHISELSDRMITHPKDVVREGDRLAVKIVKVEPERKRIGLSLKQVAASEEAAVLRSYAAAEGEHRVERPALNAEMAAELSKAVSEASQPAESGGGQG